VTFERPAASTSQPQVTFTRRPPHVGDRADQSLLVELQVRNSIRNGTEVVGETDTSMAQRLQRIVTTGEVRGAQMVAARVQYVVSEREVEADGQTTATQQDPIAGHAYRCRRDGEQLLVTDDQGHLPPLAEFKIVADSMDALGKPNPLAEFLGDKTLAVGEQLTLPVEVAQEFAQRMGEGIDQVERFELSLTEVKPIAGRRCAVFRAFMEASENKSRQMKLQLDGTMAIELDSCRMVSAELAGPIGLAESVNNMGATYQVTGIGRMNFAIHSSYDDAEE
jgi:hypothetical protein